MDIKIDKSKWSSQSQRSLGGHYDLGAKHYENISVRCYKCSRSFVCTAAAQKEAYEIEKRFISWLPSRCSKCQKELDVLLAQNSEFQDLWNSDKESVKENLSLMKNWLHLLRDISSYGKNTNESMIVCLVKCLNET